VIGEPLTAFRGVLTGPFCLDDWQMSDANDKIIRSCRKRPPDPQRGFHLSRPTRTDAAVVAMLFAWPAVIPAHPYLFPALVAS